MTEQELTDLFKNNKIVKAEFDYEFEFWFDNGVSVTVGKTMEYDCCLWEIESNIEADERKRKWDEEKKLNLLMYDQKEKQKGLLIEKYGQEAFDNFTKIFE